MRRVLPAYGHTLYPHHSIGLLGFLRGETATAAIEVLDVEPDQIGLRQFWLTLSGSTEGEQDSVADEIYGEVGIPPVRIAEQRMDVIPAAPLIVGDGNGDRGSFAA
jgi:hypothetical protein